MLRPLPALLLSLAACECGSGTRDSTPAPTDSPTLPADTQDSAPPQPTAPIEDLWISEHAQVSTMLEVYWTQLEEVDSVWVEFGLEGEPVLTTPATQGSTGDHHALLLGLPADTSAQVRVVNQRGDELLHSATLHPTTGSLPDDLPVPSLTHHDPELITPEPWLVGSLGINDQNWYAGPWYLYAMDRQARIVWYWAVPEGRATMHARVALDGDHLLFEETTIYLGDQGKGSLLHRMGLDLERDELIDASGLGSTFAETADGTILFDSYTDDPLICLDELFDDGSRRRIWTCTEWLMQHDGQRPSACDPNETLWFPETDSVIWSMWPNDTAVEIDRKTGEILAQWGSLEGSWRFDPPTAGFDMQHYPYFTDAGTLLVSTHVPGRSDQHRAREYEVDRDEQVLREIWSYGDEVPHYPTYAGEALRHEGGNTLINYGSDGAMREITPDKTTAWQVDWDSGYLLGHVTLVDDLYALTSMP